MKTIAGYLERLCSLKRFIKELKERFSRWFNKRHGRRGTLWQDRYGSILVEDGEVLRTMTAYLDLNPLRVGLVDDSKDYRWWGFFRSEPFRDRHEENGSELSMKSAKTPSQIIGHPEEPYAGKPHAEIYEGDVGKVAFQPQCYKHHAPYARR